ncbi:alpha-methylacyl-CoA racemase isoform X2 [Prorops nasuta]
MSDPLGNGKRSIALDIKNKEGQIIFKKLSDKSDVIIDPFRPGVMERLMLGPNELMSTNKRLIYARLTGFGQSGPYSNMAGHDINYLALSGLLSLFGRANEKPTAPVNFAADFAGGGLICAFGILLSLLERTKSGLGQVIDASMVEGAAYVGSWLFRSQNMPFLWNNPRGENLLDTGTHFYDTYETKDNKFMSVGALEPQFYEQFIQKLGLSTEEISQYNEFEEKRSKISTIFKSKTQAEWCDIFNGTDACVVPVVNINEAALHPHNKSRQSFLVDKNNLVIPNSVPKLSRTPGKSAAVLRNPEVGKHTTEILLELNYSAKMIKNLLSSGIVKQFQKRAKL